MLRIFRFLALVGMMVAATVASIMVLANGCESISFDAHGRRATTIQCYFDDSGALPALPAALVVLAAVFTAIVILARSFYLSKTRQFVGSRNEVAHDAKATSPSEPAAATSSSPTRAERSDQAIAERLETLIGLHAKGLLSDEEFAERRTTLLDEI